MTIRKAGPEIEINNFPLSNGSQTRDLTIGKRAIFLCAPRAASVYTKRTMTNKYGSGVPSTNTKNSFDIFLDLIAIMLSLSLFWRISKVIFVIKIIIALYQSTVIILYLGSINCLLFYFKLASTPISNSTHYFTISNI